MINLYIQDFCEKHLDATYQWMQNDLLKRDFMFSSIVTKSSHIQWYKHYCADETQKNWAIFFDDKHVGNMGLKNIDYHNRNAEFWIYIGEFEYHGKHIGTNVFPFLLENTTFKVLALHKIYSYVADWNVASQKMFLNIGFREEGLLQEEFFFDGDYVTLHRFGLILNQ